MFLKPLFAWLQVLLLLANPATGAIQAVFAHYLVCFLSQDYQAFSLITLRAGWNHHQRSCITGYPRWKSGRLRRLCARSSILRSKWLRCSSPSRPLPSRRRPRVQPILLTRSGLLERSLPIHANRPELLNPEFILQSRRQAILKHLQRRHPKLWVVERQRFLDKRFPAIQP